MFWIVVSDEKDIMECNGGKKEWLITYWDDGEDDEDEDVDDDDV